MLLDDPQKRPLYIKGTDLERKMLRAAWFGNESNVGGLKIAFRNGDVSE
jgi:hypothetical protein